MENLSRYHARREERQGKAACLPLSRGIDELFPMLLSTSGPGYCDLILEQFHDVSHYFVVSSQPLGRRVYSRMHSWRRSSFNTNTELSAAMACGTYV